MLFQNLKNLLKFPIRSITEADKKIRKTGKFLIPTNPLKFSTVQINTVGSSWQDTFLISFTMNTRW